MRVGETDSDDEALFEGELLAESLLVEDKVGEMEAKSVKDAESDGENVVDMLPDVLGEDDAVCDGVVELEVENDSVDDPVEDVDELALIEVVVLVEGDAVSVKVVDAVEE